MKIPAEWSKHRACWLAYPCDEEVWGDSLRPAQKEFLQLVEVIARSEMAEILCATDDAKTDVQTKLGSPQLQTHHTSYWDIWLRDTGPVFGQNDLGETAAIQFQFNGWGKKYFFEDDVFVASRIAERASAPIARSPLVCEGGALEFNGVGTLLTTEQCLLNSNRNPERSKSDIEEELQSFLGVEEIVWIKRGLLNDHTDGHIDNMARFVGPKRVLCMKPAGASDPQADVLQEIEASLRERFEILTLDGPGEVTSKEGDLMPASYLNYYISNEHVIVPQFGVSNDRAAVQKIASLFPERHTVGLSAKALLTGGGTFHCITQQEPEAR